MAPYNTIFLVTLGINVILTIRSSGLWEKITGSSSAGNNGGQIVSEEEKSRHRSLLARYLCVYLLATLSDWLQGPYVYALYDAYGFSQHDIAVLFVAGFGSSMVFGSFIGGMADMCGRRKFVILFSAIYAASCITKHFNDYWILMLGRLLGGVATSLLFSVFEAWLIRSHTDAKIDKAFLSSSFSSAAYGNSIIAIVAGLVANKAASSTEMAAIGEKDTFSGMVMLGGFVNPFDIALVALVACGFCAATLWEENYGETSVDDAPPSDGSSDDGGSAKEDPKWYEGLNNAYMTTMRNRDILWCGIISSLFEGSMYVFVFMWTPALQGLMEDKTEGLPFGLIFSTFMVCCMAGSSLFSILVSKIKGEALAVGVFSVAMVAFGVVATSTLDTLSFCCMLVFEMCVGMYFPIMGTMKGVIVPEDKRAAIYNLFRIPLNFIVLFSLLTDLKPEQSFALCCIMMLVATIMQFQLMKRRLNSGELQGIITKKQQNQQQKEEDADESEKPLIEKEEV